jgi:heat shock protein HslJ
MYSKTNQILSICKSIFNQRKPMPTQIFFGILAMIVGLNLASCAPISSADASNNALNQTSWVLTGLNNQAVRQEPVITLSFENDQIAGTDGCNRYHGSYTLNADKLSINKHIASTMMACPEPITRQAAAYISALMATVSYKIDGQQLLLMNASGKTLARFNKQAMELGGTAWQVLSVNNGKQAVVSTIIGSKLTVNFSTDGKLSGLAGCNQYTASYEVSGKTIKISSVAATRKLCMKLEGIMEQEAQFLRTLETVTSYRIDGTRLELRTATNALAIMAKRLH